jgi:hypothetical protein
MFTLVFALAMLQSAPVVVPPGPLTISWNHSPTGGAGSARFGGGYGPGQEEFGPGWTEEGGWQLHFASGDYFQLQVMPTAVGNPPPMPRFWLNTSRDVFPWTGGPGPHVFQITNYAAAPFLLEYTCAAPDGSNWGANLIITITGGP